MKVLINIQVVFVVTMIIDGGKTILGQSARVADHFEGLGLFR